MTLTNLIEIIDKYEKVRLVKWNSITQNHQILFEGYFEKVPENLKTVEVLSISSIHDSYTKADRLLVMLNID